MIVIIALLWLAGLMPQLRTTAGRDWQCKVMGDTASTGTGAYAAANYIGLSTTDEDPDAADTTMAGEITTGALARTQAVYAHTLGTNSYTLTKVFTSDDTVTVYRAGVFNAASAGTLAFHSRLDDPTPLRPGDTIQVTEVIGI